MTKWTDEAIVEWHKKAFPNATLETQLKKVEDELQEMHDAIDDLIFKRTTDDTHAIEEAADVYIASVALFGRFDSRLGALALNYIMDVEEEMIKAARQGVPNSAIKLRETINAKMNKNAKRTWHETAPGYYQHVETVQ